MHLQELLSRIHKTWSCHKENYPNIDVADGISERRHVVLHAMKAVGVLAGQHEGHDHGHQDTDAYREATAKLVIDALKLAALQGMREEDLVEEVVRILDAVNS
ncbi:MAG: hypothetical protein QY323_05575 [Patescibacteria group bacterium]|nr:MAG: hypothetical protein QY323_05575 [Patescibacteria group bacterium]